MALSEVSTVRVPRASTVMRWGGALRFAALTGVVAAAFGVVIAPGLRGNAPESTVEKADFLASSLGYFLCFVLMNLSVRGTVELFRTSRAPLWARGILMPATLTVVVLSMLGMTEGGLGHLLPPIVSLVLAGATAFIGVIAGLFALRAPHTRAAALIITAISLSAVFRIASWPCAASAGERLSITLLSWARVLATIGLAFEALSQLAAATWIGVRHRRWGVSISMLALVAAVAVTWGAERGGNPQGAAPWQAVLHSALSGGSGLLPPVPYLQAIAIFVVPSAVLLAGASGIPTAEPLTVSAAIALSLLSRGSLDAAPRALAMCTAGIWTMLAAFDGNSLWASFADKQKKDKLDP